MYVLGTRRTSCTNDLPRVADRQCCSCHRHLLYPLASTKSRIETYWYRLTQVHLEKWSLNRTEREREREREWRHSGTGKPGRPGKMAVKMVREREKQRSQVMSTYTANTDNASLCTRPIPPQLLINFLPMLDYPVKHTRSPSRDTSMCHQ